MNNLRLALFVSILLIPAISYGGDDVVRKMQLEPATMLDLGIYRLKEHLERKLVAPNNGIYAAIIDSVNRENLPGGIIIKLHYEATLFENEKDKCEDIIKRFREEEYIAKSDYSSEISGFFMHNQFIKRGYGMNSSGQRDIPFAKLIVDTFTVQAIHKGGKPSCYGPWNGSSITFK